MRGYSIKTEGGAPRFLGLFHFLGIPLWADASGGAGCWKVGKILEIHDDRLKPGVTPCIAVQFPCFHPLWHGGVVSIKYAPRKSYEPV